MRTIAVLSADTVYRQPMQGGLCKKAANKGHAAFLEGENRGGIHAFDVFCTIRPDHHLTTPSPSWFRVIVFYVPTFFYNHQNQHRKLCTLHNFRRWFMLFACASQFSDNCGTLGNRKEIARHNVKKQAHHPVARGRLTTN